MAAYRRVCDSRHLQADCQGPGSAPEPYARQSSTGHFYIFYLTLFRWLVCRSCIASCGASWTRWPWRSCREWCSRWTSWTLIRRSDWKAASTSSLRRLITVCYRYCYHCRMSLSVVNSVASTSLPMTNHPWNGHGHSGSRDGDTF